MQDSQNFIRRFILPPIVISVLFIVLSGFMLIIGLLIYLVYTLPESKGIELEAIPVYEKLALIVVLAWVALLIAYYAWQIYFYNYNYGKSSAFWKKFIQMSHESGRKTEAQLYKELGAPNRNPFFDQTFGLPPGTVRGTMALTVLVGGLCLLILAIGGSELFKSGAFAREFTFFEQAFLMVIAFYFGTKGFEIMQQQQTKRLMAQMSNPELNRQAKAAATKVVEGEMEEPLVEKKTVPAATIPATAPAKTVVASATVLPASAAADITDGASLKPGAATALVVNKDVIVKNIDQHYPHVSDLEANIFLHSEQIQSFAELYGLEVPAVRAVIEIESSGKGFLKDERPKILFEGHVFWRRLKAYKINPVPLSRTNPSIVYQNWTRQHYLTGTLEYQRLNKAKAIHDSAALESASWGMFQIMGYHSYKMGYKTVQEFVRAQEKSEEEHLKAFGLFITKISPQCHKALQNHNWADFAKNYNGAQYARNQYDSKLEKAYHKFKSQPQMA